MERQRFDLFAALAVLLLLAAIVLAAWYYYGAPEPGSFEMEVAKAILQLGVVAVVGAAVSVLSFEHQRKRQQSDRDREYEREHFERDQERERRSLEYREDLLKNVLARAMASYSSVKRARRLLRARARNLARRADVDDDWLILTQPYDEYMDAVNVAQLELENLARDIETSKPAFSSSTELVTAVWSMERFLEDLIAEYENLRPRFQGNPATKTLSEFRALPPFLESPSSVKFKDEFVGPYHRVQQGIRTDLLHPRIGTA